MSVQIAVFDLDGVIFKSPVPPRKYMDTDFWRKYWSDIDAHEPNRDVLTLMDALFARGIKVLILTARPVSILPVTRMALLEKCGLRPSFCDDVVRHNFYMSSPVHLMMGTDELMDSKWTIVPEWKRVIIEDLTIRCDVLFAVDDRRQNVEEMRKVVPAYLYEQHRPGGD